MAELVSNVYVDGAWYGPDYPDAGDPPSGKVTNPAAFGKATEEDVRSGRAEKVGGDIDTSKDGPQWPSDTERETKQDPKQDAKGSGASPSGSAERDGEQKKAPQSGSQRQPKS